MSTGDAPDMLARLRGQMPRRWFPDVAPALTALLSGFASVWASMYALNRFVRQQQRLATATGAFADIAVLDYFAPATLRRKPEEPDAAFTARARAALLLPRGTRPSLIAALAALTGTAPRVFYPAFVGDTGGYGSLATPSVPTGLAYNMAGGYGSLALPWQAFVDVTRPIGGGVAGIAGYGSPVGGYGVGAIEYASRDMISGGVTDADINAAVAAQVPAGCITWMRIGAPAAN